MTTFVLAGKADCPYLAKAEHLADVLHRSLPDFRFRKKFIHPDQWKEWLEDTCKMNGWQHKQSPLIWTELLDHGGKSAFLGGFSDFSEYCQEYFGITADMSSDRMLRIAAENLETTTKILTQEQQHRLRRVRPVNIWITSALHPTCHYLIPHLVSAEMFPGVSAISLYLLDQEGSKEELNGLKMEAEDLAAPLLHQVNVHTDPDDAFNEAHVIILLDDRWPEEDEEDDEGEKGVMRLKKVTSRYRRYGLLMDKMADRGVKVLVAGDRLVNLRCSLLLESAPSINAGRFVAMATQLEHEARALVANKMRVDTSDITDVTVWGNISGSFHIDLQRARVFNYDGAIRGPSSFSQPVEDLLYDRRWLKTSLPDLVRTRRETVASKTQRPAAMSATNAILTLLKAWSGISHPSKVLSLGVQCSGYYDLPDGIVFSMPVTFSDGEWTVLDVSVGEDLRKKLLLFADELSQEKERAATR